MLPRMLLVAIATVPLAAGAEAAIVCRGEYQVIGGQEISTPYCNDAYFAKVARGYGYKVTDDAIRNNPALKEEVCRFAGHDTRIRIYCPQNGDGGRR